MNSSAGWSAATSPRATPRSIIVLERARSPARPAPRAGPPASSSSCTTAWPRAWNSRVSRTSTLARVPGHLAQVPGEGAGVDPGEADTAARAQRGRHELRLRLPLPVERRLAAPRGGGDALHGHGVVTALADLFEHSVEELLLTLRRDLGAARGDDRLRSVRCLRRHGPCLLRSSPCRKACRNATVPERLRIGTVPYRYASRFGTVAYRYTLVSVLTRIGTPAYRSLALPDARCPYTLTKLVPPMEPAPPAPSVKGPGDGMPAPSLPRAAPAAIRGRRSSVSSCSSQGSSSSTSSAGSWRRATPPRPSATRTACGTGNAPSICPARAPCSPRCCTATPLVHLANTYYATVHFPATAAFLVWLYLRRPAHYVWARRVLAAAHRRRPGAAPRLPAGAAADAGRGGPRRHRTGVRADGVLGGARRPTPWPTSSRRCPRCTSAGP